MSPPGSGNVSSACACPDQPAFQDALAHFGRKPKVGQLASCMPISGGSVLISTNPERLPHYLSLVAKQFQSANGSPSACPDRLMSSVLHAQIALPRASGLRAAKPPLPDEQAQEAVDGTAADPDQPMLAA